MSTARVGYNKVISLATELFVRKGYSDTSIADIASACGIRKSSLYHYITSKEDLAEKVLAHQCDIFKKDIFAIAYDEQLSEAERLNALLDKLVEFYSASQNGCLMGNWATEITDSNPQLAQYIRDFFSAWVDAFAVVFKPKFNGQSVQVAEDCVQRFQGALMLKRVFDNSAVLERAVADIKNLLG
ncbi:MAG: hypothetical protein CMF50_03030 [Legionellales bacterium]|nr:hypothetical protein [Legionellales bacterium]|tara:strand:- start:22036 stop:22590 length:555 start_codon:yes stop_codon:yes gene_type:complete